jgi:hypothetical protein
MAFIGLRPNPNPSRMISSDAMLVMDAAMPSAPLVG